MPPQSRRRYVSFINEVTVVRAAIILFSTGHPSPLGAYFGRQSMGLDHRFLLHSKDRRNWSPDQDATHAASTGPDARG
jgi:hypothetical protein